MHTKKMIAILAAGLTVAMFNAAPAHAAGNPCNPCAPKAANPCAGKADIAQKADKGKADQEKAKKAASNPCAPKNPCAAKNPCQPKQ